MKYYFVFYTLTLLTYKYYMTTLLLHYLHKQSRAIIQSSLVHISCMLTHHTTRTYTTWSFAHSRPQCLGVCECARKLWETLRQCRQNLAIWASQGMIFDPVNTFCFLFIYFIAKVLCCFGIRTDNGLLRWLDLIILWEYHPTLKLSGIPTFTLIVSLTYSMDNI